MKKNYITLMAFMGSLSLLAQTNIQNVAVEIPYNQSTTDTYNPNAKSSSAPDNTNQADRAGIRRSNAVIKVGITNMTFKQMDQLLEELFCTMTAPFPWFGQLPQMIILVTEEQLTNT